MANRLQLQGSDIVLEKQRVKRFRRSGLLKNHKPVYLARTWSSDCLEGPPDIAPFEDLGAALEFRKRFRRGFVERWPDRAVWDDDRKHWTRPIPP